MSESPEGHPAPPKDPGKPLFIFVNRRRFDEGDGVLHQMTGAQIAALISVPAENAVVRREIDGHEGPEIPVTESIAVHAGDRFFVTRKIVEGGHA
ncbi:MAG: hypothetical protein HY084_12070 [Gemmatimonadetes bacterium]|nr:hypothetical protein [Gemmatimonadota bacterium]